MKEGCDCYICGLSRRALTYQKAPLLQGYGRKGFCIGCGFSHHPNYPNCVWLKDIG